MTSKGTIVRGIRLLNNGIKFVGLNNLSLVPWAASTVIANIVIWHSAVWINS